jgi:hypothetical protein
MLLGFRHWQNYINLFELYYQIQQHAKEAFLVYDV